MEIDSKYMYRCLQLARNGLGTTYPNPMVGSVIVYKNKIIGEGWHYQSGKPHAEVNAISSVSDKNLLRNSTLYVNLEPCSYYGKTPPCTHKIISSGIKKIVIGSIDENDKVNKKGIEYLKNSGCDVHLGLLEDKCVELNKRFFTFIRKKRPYIVLKWVETRDGFIDKYRDVSTIEKARPTWISSIFSRQIVHKWRTQEQAVLVGTNTAIKDNPYLTARDWSGNQPIRVLIDRELKTPKNYHLFDNSNKTIIFTGKKNIKSTEKLIHHTIDFNEDIIKQILNFLYQYDVQSLIVEGGRRTLCSFIELNLWDEARVFKGDICFKRGIKAPRINNSSSIEKINLNSDVLNIYKNDLNLE